VEIRHTVIIVTDRLVLVYLNLDPTLGCESGNVHGFDDFPVNCWISLAFQAVIEGAKICSSSDVLHVQRLPGKHINICFSQESARPTSSMSKLSASGARFGPDQKGVPFELT